MKCLNRAQMEEFILEEASAGAGLNIHVQNCSRCQALMAEVGQEQEAWSQALYPEQLTDDFTRQVMASLADVPIEPAVEENEPDTILLRKKRRSPFIRRAALAAACLLIVAAALTVYAQPSIADWVRSIFARDNTDIGLLDSQTLGLVQNPHIKVKDKGYTLEINEVVVDAARIMMGVKITDPNGKPVVNKVDWSQVTVKDTEGKEVAKLHSLGGSAVIENVSSLFPDGVQSDTLTVEGKITQIGRKLFSHKVVKGNWNFKFSLDMKKANELTKVTLLDQQYTTPDGLHVKMERLVRTPSAVRLELSTSLDGKLAKLVPESGLENMLLMYHFEDENGTDFSSVNNHRSPHMETLIAEQPQLDGDTLRWYYTFKYLPYDREKVRFVLDGYSIPVISDDSVQFHPLELSLKPVEFKGQGDSLTISSMKIGQDPNSLEKETVGLLQVEGKFRNMFSHDEWVMRDEKSGREFPASFRGSYGGLNEFQEVNGDPGFIVEGLTTLPEKATLIRKVTDKWYTNVNWSFDLPKGEPIKGLENVNPEDYWDAP
ncbi:DUF4179 domain-containing protein [Paenibacillus sp. Y412MC10]|uniref:DUF4179 domain-containing protein n=1 Tax=Geobacillus sp. (strain Y412MC10) TaxID=481743 RepID=UPI0011AB6654|nr:DUF4179 domain-containing protein [Paenibacillus sp. Y412MC10]